MSKATPTIVNHADGGDDEVLLTAAQVAQRLGLQSQTLSVWRLQRRNLPFIRVGQRVRYRLADVRSFIDQQTVAATTPARRRHRRGGDGR